MAPGTERVRGAYRVVKPSITWGIARSVREVVAYLTLVNTAYRVTHMYTNGIYARDERHEMKLFLGLKHFIRGVIIQMKPMK